jgi:hypothetical protein
VTTVAAINVAMWPAPPATAPADAIAPPAAVAPPIAAVPPLAAAPPPALPPMPSSLATRLSGPIAGASAAS